MCFSGVCRGSTDNKDGHCWGCSFDSLLMMRLGLNADLEVKVEAPPTRSGDDAAAYWSSGPQKVSTRPNFHIFVEKI